MEALWNGILFGLLLTVFIGPVFFALIQTSIQKGFASGFFMAIGISLSDIIYISVTYIGISKLFSHDSFTSGLGFGGGAIMLVFGLSSILKPVTHQAVVRQGNKRSNLIRNITKGFLLNGLNPSVLIFWIGVASMATVNYQYSGNQVIIFFSGIVGTVFITDIFKTFVANRLRKVLTLRLMKIMNIVVGIGLILFGLRLFYYAM